MAVLALVVSLVVLAGSALDMQEKPIPACPLSEVLTTLRDAKATASQRDALVGKVYAGVVVVEAVRLQPDGIVALVDASSEDSDGGGPVRLRFEGRAHDAALQTLRRRGSVSVAGTLKELSAGSAYFTDLRISVATVVRPCPALPGP